MGLKDGEPTWCTKCETFFEESIQAHGAENHQGEMWDVDYGKEPPDEGDVRSLGVLTKDDEFLDPVGPLHRADEAARCANIPAHRATTDLATALVGDGHRLCDVCLWPDEARELVEAEA